MPRRTRNPATGCRGADASGPAHGRRRDPLQYSAMAHVVEALCRQRHDHRIHSPGPGRDGVRLSTLATQRFVPGAHSVVSAEGGRRRSDLRLGWQAVRGQHQAAEAGPLDHRQLRAVGADGKHLVEKVHRRSAVRVLAERVTITSHLLTRTSEDRSAMAGPSSSGRLEAQGARLPPCVIARARL